MKEKTGFKMMQQRKITSMIFPRLATRATRTRRKGEKKKTTLVDFPGRFGYTKLNNGGDAHIIQWSQKKKGAKVLD